MLSHRVQPRCCHHDHESPLTHATENDQRRPDSTTYPARCVATPPPRNAPEGVPRFAEVARRHARCPSRPAAARSAPRRSPRVTTRNSNGARSLRRCCHRLGTLPHRGQKSASGATDHSGLAENQRSLPKQRPPENDDPHRSEDHRRPARSGWQAIQTGSRRSHTLSRKRGNCLLRRLIPTARIQGWPPLDRPGTSPEADRKRPVPTSKHMRETRHTPGRRGDVATTETSS